VYIAGFAPETGESAAFLSGKFPGSMLSQTLEEIPPSDGQVDLRMRQDLFPLWQISGKRRYWPGNGCRLCW
jgi:hypothetical protein